MKTQYILDPETNTVRRLEYEETISNLSEFVDALSADREIVTPTLPKDCVQYRANDSGFAYVIYKPADILKFGVSGLVGEHQLLMSDLEMAVPDRLYIFRGGRGLRSRNCQFVFTRAQKREDFASADVAQPWLPNMYSGLGSFCGGPTFENICTDSGSLSDQIDRAVDYMENSMFNNDLDSFIEHIPQPTRLRAEDCFGVELDGLDWSDEIREAVDSGSWNGPLRCFLRMHLATKRMLAAGSRDDVIRAVRGDMESAYLRSYSSL